MRSLSLGLVAVTALVIAAPANAPAAAPRGAAAPAAPAVNPAPAPARVGAPNPAFRFGPRPGPARFAPRPAAFRFHPRPGVRFVPAPLVIWDWDWPPPVWDVDYVYPDYAYVPTCRIVRERIRTKKKRVIVREREVCD
jgi:hypothetical protein